MLSTVAGDSIIISIEAGDSIVIISMEAGDGIIISTERSETAL
jgi:hypothetical protein